ncbi:MAG: DUF159 family protein [Crocinitomicaceae bacterium]|nr:DUF159 family protein [Crocinitomicaceae bacterium]|tara:strand:+ start:488 stop:1105 length:618 start_codon:yes stop_codon:yes gene_type:complete
MCYHKKLQHQKAAIEQRFKAEFEPNATAFQPTAHSNGFTFPKDPVITNKDTKTLHYYQWGLIPAWAKDDSFKQYTLNAKIETLHEKPSFKNVVNNRCLIPADGFYEWQWLDPKGKQKQQYLITLPNEALFAFGGIWSEWVDKTTGEIVHSYSIVTTAANALMSKIHNTKKRIPVILSPENENNWLNGQSFEAFKTVNLDLKATPV